MNDKQINEKRMTKVHYSNNLEVDEAKLFFLLGNIVLLKKRCTLKQII